MTSVVDLCNRSLIDIGTRSTIASLLESSNEAKACALLYGPTLLETLEAANWDFAEKTQALTLLAQSPLVDASATPSTTAPVVWSFMPWAYEYAYPADCVKFRRILAPFFGVAPAPMYAQGPWPYGPSDQQPVIRWALGGDTDASGADNKVILSYQPQAVGKWTKLVTNPDLFDGSFQNAIVGRLAAKLVGPLSGNMELAKLAIEKGLQAEAMAEKKAANEGVRIQERTAEWIRARGAGGNAYPYSDEWFEGVGGWPVSG